MYAIYNNVAGQWLESWHKGGKYCWVGGDKPQKLFLFTYKKDADRLIPRLEQFSRNAGENSFDFQVVEVREVKHYERADG